MSFRKDHTIFAIILIIVIGANFFRVGSVHADGETPTEPPVPTQVQEEPPTEPAIVSTPEPFELTVTPVAEVLTQVPDGTEVIVLDENGVSVPLAAEEAGEIAGVVDPMWCPEGILPGGPGCTTNFASISALLNNMESNTSAYTQNGVIYFTADPGTGTFALNPVTLGGGDFEMLNDFNLTLQGGWNGDTVAPSFSGQTDFSNRPITIGTAVNPWVGNITISDITFSGASQTSLRVYTTTGDITLNNVDVNNQSNGQYTAHLNTDSGDITVSDGNFDGNNSNSTGFSAVTGSGSITINNSFFTEIRIPGPSSTANGATLDAPTITLNNVSATGNDGNGIRILSASLVTLNNVTANNNGTELTPAGFTNNAGSGLFFQGVAGSILVINGGAFNNNQRYGIEVGDPANTTIYIQSAPDCTGNDSNAAPISSCSNGTFINDTTAPTLSLPADMTVSAGPAGTAVNYSVFATDDSAPTISLTCTPASGSIFLVGTTTVNCFATDTAGNTTLGSFLVTVVDTTIVVTPTPLAPPSPTPASGSVSETSISGSSPIIIPVTGGKVVRLDCNSAFWAFDIKLTFINLCDHQTIVNSVERNTLPGELPSEYSFVAGLDLSVLHGNQVLTGLPAGSSIQMDFPALGNDQFTVLHWNGSTWIEIPHQAGSDANFYQITTTDKLGVFILVKK